MDLSDLTDQFFEAAAGGDVDGMLSLCAPDCRFKQNIGDEGGTDVLRALVEGLAALGVTVSYSDVRRIVADGAVTEQHLVTLTRADGEAITADVCVVLRFDDDGRITRLDEYLDGSSLSAALT